MKKIIITTLTFIFIIPLTYGVDFGLSAGVGAPFVSQYAVDVSFGSNWGMSLSQNALSAESGEASVDLSSNVAIVNWHIFSGSFYIGLGIGQEELEVSAKESSSSLVASASVTTNSLLGRLGWMWGKADAGFWFGADIS